VDPWGSEARRPLQRSNLFESELLRGTRSATPHEQATLGVSAPGYDNDPERRYRPSYMIQGLTGKLAHVA